MTDPLRPLLDAAPDAVVVVDTAGRIILANQQASELFGYTEEELVGATVEMLVPLPLRGAHVDHRAAFRRAPTSRTMAAGQDLDARHRDGRSLPVDIALAPVVLASGEHGVAAFVRDSSRRRQLAEQQRRIRDGELARAQALELNDSVVQGLTAITWLLEEGSTESALRAARETLASARGMMSELLGESHGEIAPGELRRREPAREVGVSSPDGQAPSGDPGGLRVVIADDSADVRLLLRSRLQMLGDVQVVAEVADGAAALEAVADHEPDVILLDLSMPVMDGFEAAERLRERHPGLRIVVLSGHPAEQMEQRARSCGADEYLEKGASFDGIIDAIRASHAGA